MITCQILPSPATGKNRRIELSGIDLWLNVWINNIFVYPSVLDIDQLKKAVGHALARYPLVSGQLLLLNSDRYFIEMSDHSIPISFTENNELSKWPLDSTVVISDGHTLFKPYLSPVPTEQSTDNSQHEPLFHMKLTHIVQSDELIMGISWSHILGDGASCLDFLSTVSRLYQNLEPLKPDPIFERRLWQENEANQAFVPVLKLLRDAEPKEHVMTNFMSYLAPYEQINLKFSSEQLAQLHKLAGEPNVTIQDALTAYIILLLNTYCFDDDEQQITHAGTIINFRGVSDSIAPIGHIANSVFLMLSTDFEDPQSLSSIALTIRSSIIKSRDRTFLEPCLATMDSLMRKIAREARVCRIQHYRNEIIVNSNFKFDWANLVDFGHKDQCRFYTTGAGPFYLRIFRLNPIHDGMQWVERDRQGAEVAFLINKNIKSRFMNAWHKDIEENFALWKK